MFARKSLNGVFTILILLGLFLCVGGCSEKNGPGTNGPDGDPDAAQEKVEEANALLEDILFDLIDGDDPEVPADIDLSGPYDLYNEALTLDSDHVGANFGSGILEVMMLTQDPQVQDFFDRVKAFLEADEYFDTGQGFKPFTGSLARPGLVLSLDRLAVPLISPVKMTRSMCRVVTTDDPTVNELQQMILNEVLPRIGTALTRLNVVTTDQAFVFIVTPKMQGDLEEDAVELDLTEVYTTLTGLYAAQAVLWHFCAYNFNLEVYTGEEMLAALTPGSSFGSLYSNGESRMSNARQAWVRALDNLEAGIEFLESEIDPQENDLIRIDPYDDLTQADLDTIKYYLPKAKNVLNASEMVWADWDDDSSTPNSGIEISLNSFYSQPIQDLKSLFPAYTPSLAVQEYTSWEHEDTLVQALVDIHAGGWYYWYREASYSYGTEQYYWENTNIDVPDEWNAVWDLFVQRISDQPYAHIESYYLGQLSQGQQILESEIWISYDKFHSRYVPRITWNATSFYDWVLPDPTIGGLLPGMNDWHFKETFGIEEDDWERASTLYFW